MTSIQVFKFDGSAELFVRAPPVDIEANRKAPREGGSNLVVGNVGWQSGDVQNGFVEVRMGFSTISGERA